MAFLRTFLRDAARRTFRLSAAATVIVAALISAAVCAQGPSTTVTSPAAAKPAIPGRMPAVPKTMKKTDSKPTWNELTPAQQQALAPLLGEWDKMESGRKEKWLVIANKFAAMKPAEQDRLHERMRDWIKLTPAQRRAIRESYARAKKLDAQKKSAQWQQYQQLSEEQKKKLAQAKLPKHVASIPGPRGKAPAKLPQQALEHALQPKPIAPTAPTLSVVPAAPQAVPTEAK